MTKKTTKAPNWKPGQSGNPAGRPKGRGLSAKLRKAIQADAEDVIAAIVRQAKNGDVAAAKVLLDRVLPPLKATAEPVTVKGLSGGSFVERASAALDAAASGKLPPDVAAQLVQAVATIARVAEISELEQRIAALEAKHQ